jgi:addiction module antidote protein HigA
MELPQIDPIHPGEILHDFITGTSTSVEAVAAATGISSKLLHRILSGEQGITPETADRLGNHFGTTPQLWVNLQHQYDKDRKG